MQKRRGTTVVAMVVLMLILELIVVGIVSSGARGHVLVTKTLLFATSGRSLVSRGTVTEALAERSRALEAGEASPIAEDDWRLERPRLWAFDKKTGDVVATVELPAHSDGSPITFLHKGRQYLVFALGGRGDVPELIAYRIE